MIIVSILSGCFLLAAAAVRAAWTLPRRKSWKLSPISSSRNARPRWLPGGYLLAGLACLSIGGFILSTDYTERALSTGNIFGAAHQFLPLIVGMLLVICYVLQELAYVPPARATWRRSKPAGRRL